MQPISAHSEPSSLVITSYEQMVKLLQPVRSALLAHPIYRRVSCRATLRSFMTSHVFAVWDFMTLLKSLQRRLTCVEPLWLPAADAEMARLINEIVLAEETDEVAPGRFLSHFELYLGAMADAGADTTPITGFVHALRQGQSAAEALAPLPIPASTKGFVLLTLKLAEQSIPEVAASFLLGREDVIPAMFHRLLTELDVAGDERWEDFRLYLDRHIHLDADRHGPMGERLLRKLCGRNPAILGAAYRAAYQSIVARLLLWDGICDATPS
jgi:hypothetical protein